MDITNSASKFSVVPSVTPVANTILRVNLPIGSRIKITAYVSSGLTSDATSFSIFRSSVAILGSGFS